jgi:mannose-6-phosphate isomerase-like protein (cupin superfamily)
MSGIPRATLANMERSASNPSISAVVKVASALGVTVEDLVDRQQSALVTTVHRQDMEIYRQDDGKFVSTRLSPINAPFIQINEINMLPGCFTRGKPHPEGSHEFLICLEGTALMEIQQEKIEVEAGNMVYFPGNLPHNYANAGLKPVQAISIVFITSTRQKLQAGSD